MTVSVRGPVPAGPWTPHTAQHLTERLKAVEKALGDGSAAFLAPSIPTFGPGTITGGGGSTGGGTSGGTGGTVTTIIEKEEPTLARTFLLMGG